MNCTFDFPRFFSEICMQKSVHPQFIGCSQPDKTNQAGGLAQYHVLKNVPDPKYGQSTVSHPTIAPDMHLQQ